MRSGGGIGTGGVGWGVGEELLMPTTTRPLLVVVNLSRSTGRRRRRCRSRGRSPPGDRVGLPTVTVAVGAWLAPVLPVWLDWNHDARRGGSAAAVVDGHGEVVL